MKIRLKTAALGCELRPNCLALASEKLPNSYRPENEPYTDQEQGVGGILQKESRQTEKYGESTDSIPLTIIERAGQVSCFVLPLFFPLSFTGFLVIAGWIVMGVSLGFYYAGWIRFFVRGRDSVLA